MSVPHFPLRTERLTLRFPQESDIDTLVAYRNDPEVAALQDWPLPYPREAAVDLVAKHAGFTDLARGRGHQVMIELDGELVGDAHVALHEQGSVVGGGIAHIGFSLVRSAQGRGIAFEAMSALIEEVIERLGVHRVVAELSPDNLASARLLERLGLTYESFSRRSFWWRGVWDDNLFYSMSADDYRAWRERPRATPAGLSLVPLTRDIRRRYAQVSVHHSQLRFVTSVPEAYADAAFPEEGWGFPELLGIEADGEPVGFVMSAGPRLLRFLVDRRHQGRGIGRLGMEQWLDLRRAEGHAEVTTSWGPGKGSPEGFFRRQGFTPTGEDGEGRVVAVRRDLISG